MKRYLIKRILHSFVTLVGITIVVFIILHLAGDPTSLLLSIDATDEERILLRHEMGFDRPLYIQYIDFVKGLIKGNFGKSFRHGESALKLVLERMPATLELSLAGILFSLSLAIPVGTYSAYRPNSKIDNIGMIFVLGGQSIPIFWSGLMLILIFSVALGLLPPYGRGGFANLIMPSVSLGFFSMARIARVTRSSMINALKQDYIRTAMAKGLAGTTVVIRHAFKNAAIPIITMVGMEFGRLMGGAIITETIFAWPGVGRLTINAIYNRDYPVVQAAVFTLAVCFLFINTIVDILYTYLDPRVRFEKG